MNERAAHTYKQQQVNTATPAKMVFMLYEKALSRLQEAQRAIERKDIQSRCNANCSAQEILSHLSSTLDMDQGGEIAANLERLYTHCILRLMDVDRHNDAQAAQEVIDLLSPLRDAWAELADKSEGELRQAVLSAQQTNEPSQQEPKPLEPSSNQPEPEQPTKPGLSISA